MLSLNQKLLSATKTKLKRTSVLEGCLVFPAPDSPGSTSQSQVPVRGPHLTVFLLTSLEARLDPTASSE